MPKKRGGATLSRVHVNDDPADREIVTTEEELVEITRQIGDAFVRKMDRGSQQELEWPHGGRVAACAIARPPSGSIGPLGVG
jgi:hypothetical protein